jgi:adenine-specific DNA-methyltransferase
LNSLTFAYAEIMGRSYGGGVLELEPNEADNLPIPLAGGEMLDLREADRALRRSDDISTVLDRHDAVILVDGLGLDSSDVKTLRGIWAKLRDRRIGRKL